MTAHQRLVSSTGSSSSNTQHRAGNKRTGDVAGGAAETMSAHLLADWNTSLSLSFSSFGSSGEAAFVAKYAPTPTTLLASSSSELVHQPSPPPPPPSSDTDTTSNNSSSSYSPHEEENNNTTINTNSNNTNNNNTSYDTARFLRRGLSVASSFINNGSINTSGGQQNSHGSTSNNTSGIQKHTTKRTGNEGGAEEERSSIEIQLTTLPPDDVVADSNNNNKSPRELRQEQQLQRQWQHRQQQQQKRQQNNVEQERLKRLYEQQKHQHHYSPRQIQPQPPPQHQKSSSSVPPSPPHHRLTRRDSHRLPRVTPAARPFEKMVAPTSYLHDELSKDAAYNHAMKCGVVWQSLVGQFVNFPALWYDGEEPARPYLGCPSKANKWSFFGRHRLALPALRGEQPQQSPHNKNLLRTLVSKESSSGKLVLHIIVIDSNTNEPKEDVVVGVFHPNAKGIRPVGPSDSTASQPPQRNAAMTNLDQCRDLWLGHRSRIVAVNGKRHASRIESLLHYRNKQSVDKSPLGPKNTQGIPYHVDNTNMNGIFGRNPPFSTIFVPEQKLYKLLEERPQQQQPQQHRDRSYGSYRRPPASLTLLKAFIGSYTSSNE